MLFRELLVKNLNEDPGIEVVATAKDPFEARDMILEYKPDVMTLDVELPKMSGIEFLRKLMPQYPMPVVMISSRSDKVFDAMNAGAVDFVEKPPAGSNRMQIEEFIRNELPVKIKIASIAKISTIKKNARDSIKNQETQSGSGYSRDLIVAIGASTGGTEAIANVLKGYGTDIPGIVVVQHMPAGFTKSMADRLNEVSEIAVKEAEDGDKLEKGHIYVAPGGRHMEVVKCPDGSHKIALNDMPAIGGLRPCANITYDSLSKSGFDEIVCVVLTGMGADGTNGILSLGHHKPIHVISQSADTCVVYGMPKSIEEAGVVDEVVPLEKVAETITKNVGVK